MKRLVTIPGFLYIISLLMIIPFFCLEMKAVEELPRSEVEKQLNEKKNEKTKLEADLIAAETKEKLARRNQEALEKKAADPNASEKSRINSAALAEQWAGKGTEFQNQISYIKDRLPTLDQEIKTLTEKLSAEIQIPVEPTIDTPEAKIIKEYTNQLQSKLKKAAAEGENVGSLLINEGHDIQQLPYADQLPRLEQLQNVARSKGYDLFADTIQKRIDEIKSWDPVKEPKNQTLFEQRNDLAKKIPTDQIQIFKSKFDEYEKKVKEILESKNVNQALASLNELNELYVSFKNRNFIDRADINDLLKKDAQQLLNDITNVENGVISYRLGELMTQVEAVQLVMETDVPEDMKQLNYKKIAAVTAEIEKLKAAINQYKIENPDLLNGLNVLEQLIKEIKPPAPLQIPQDFASMEPVINDVMSVIQQPNESIEKQIADKSFLNKMKDFITLKADQIKRAIVYSFERTTISIINKFGKLKEFGLLTSEYAAQLKQSPATIKTMADIVKTVENSGILATGYARLQGVIQDPLLDAFVNAAKQMAPILKLASEQQILTQYVLSAVGAGGKLIAGFGNAGLELSKMIGGRLNNKVLTAAEVQEIDSIILQERINSLKQKKSLVEEAAKFVQKPSDEKMAAIADAAKKISDQAYQLAVQGFNALKNWWQQSTEIERFNQAKLKFLQDSSPENAIELTAALQSLAQSYEQTQRDREISAQSINFLVNVWDGYTYQEKAEAKDLVRSFFQLRDLKMGYLESVRNGIDQLNALTKDISDPLLVTISENYIAALQNVVTGKMISTIADSLQTIDVLDKQISVIKTELEGSQGAGL